jgi:signal transduction histidine kinase
MDEQQIKDALDSAFPGLNQAELDNLVHVVRVETYPPDTVICQEGAMESTLYVILDGWVEVSKHLEGDTPRILHHQGPGEFFGEMALIQDRPRAATVRTLQACTFLELTKEEFNDLLDRNPAVAFTVMRKVASRLRDSDQTAIADLRHKNLELAQAYDRLAEQERLRSEFLTTVAHELRTPLTTVQGYLHLMRSGAIQPDKTLELMPTLARHVDIIVNLANNILLLQELELITPEFEPVLVDQVVTQAISNVNQKAAECALALQVDIASDLPPVSGDAEGLGRAITALLDNAIKFSPDGGEIQVTVTRHNGSLHVEIADPGVGIPEEQLERLFKPFQRVESIGGHLFGGVGLGLPIAKHVVELHGGTIRAERRPQGGSKFTVTLPIDPKGFKKL